MHLKQLKLAGFKSFVEPTVIPFDSQLIAVVGPNGCGKSNIIDAVRWVMGESSSKTLRGESMTDVIFNGSSERKSIGQACVELLFDNSLGRIGGQYSAFHEISIKRIVTREGDSSYYLNGSRCRRRDITDIFLGTGAGTRGYSIIGQDMITRIVEARPEDLRVFIEEAALVSKYKERRREALQKIDGIVENLARLADIRAEQQKQLERLQRQAQVATRYKMLKEQERLIKTEMLALRWQREINEQTLIHQDISAMTLGYDQHQTKMVRITKDMVDKKEQIQAAEASMGGLQTHFYQLNTEIARLEESLHQLARENERLQKDKLQIEKDIEHAMNQLKACQDTSIYSEHDLALLQTQVQSLLQKNQNHQQTLQQLEIKKSEKDLQFKQMQTELHQGQRAVEIEQLQLQHIEQQYAHAQVLFEKNQSEQTMLLVDPIKSALQALETEYQVLTQQHQLDSDEVRQQVMKETELRQQLSDIEQSLHQAHDKVQGLLKEEAILRTEQNACLRSEKQVSGGLNHWQNTPRLAETIKVEAPWLPIFEWVLAESNHAIVLDSMEALWPYLSELRGHHALFVLPTIPKKHTNHPYPRLSDHLSGFMPGWPKRLDDIFVASTLLEAQEWLPHLNETESVITRDGYWLSHAWVKVFGEETENDAQVLSRQIALEKMQEVLTIEQDQLEDLAKRRDKAHQNLVAHGIVHQQLQENLAKTLARLRAVETQLNQKKQVLSDTETKAIHLSHEKEELLQQIEEWMAKSVFQIQKCQTLKERVLELDLQFQHLSEDKHSLENHVLTLRKTIHETQSELHQAELTYNQESLRASQKQELVKREEQHRDVLHQRLQVINERLLELNHPYPLLQQTLAEKVQNHQELEEQLGKQRQHLADLQNHVHEGSRLLKEEEHQAVNLQDKIQQAHIQEQAFLVRAEGFVEQLQELGTEVSAVLADIPPDVTLAQHEQNASLLDEKIKRLGAINLMAIDEHQIELERKLELDSQIQDLSEALTTLETAISKMDKETEKRFKETFDQINMRFQALFPRLFGGGRALLELSCDNLLETGILVMAQPPGKRNSTIHLLSGGEKAMTAVALVFAIFQQNPSPFCMLDEVDAPLDDLNIGRFCNLVKEMSQLVQFLFITHNKVTMEMADHLIGVTMREPGVSRVVQVDVAETLSRGHEMAL